MTEDIGDIVAKFDEDERQIAAILAVYQDYEHGVIQDKLQGFDAIRAILGGGMTEFASQLMGPEKDARRLPSIYDALEES